MVKKIEVVNGIVVAWDSEFETRDSKYEEIIANKKPTPPDHDPNWFLNNKPPSPIIIRDVNEGYGD